MAHRYRALHLLGPQAVCGSRGSRDGRKERTPRVLPFLDGSPTPAAVWLLRPELPSRGRACVAPGPAAPQLPPPSQACQAQPALFFPLRVPSQTRQCLQITIALSPSDDWARHHRLADSF